MAKEQRKVRADNIDFGQHPENNQILDGDETCKVLIAANFFHFDVLNWFDSLNVLFVLVPFIYVNKL